MAKFSNDGYNNIAVALGDSDTGVDYTDPLFKLAVRKGELRLVQSTGPVVGHLVTDSNSEVVFFFPLSIDADGAVATAKTISTVDGDIASITAT